MAYHARPLGGFLTGHFGDRFGRRNVMIATLLIAGNLIGAVAVWEFFWAISTSNVAMIYLGVFLCITIAFAGTNAVYLVFFAEMFNVKFRVSGMAIGLQLGIVVTGFAPSIIQAISVANGNAWWPAAVVTTVACVISIIAICTARETHRTPFISLVPAPPETDSAPNASHTEGTPRNDDHSYEVRHRTAGPAGTRR